MMNSLVFWTNLLLPTLPIKTMHPMSFTNCSNNLMHKIFTYNYKWPNDNTYCYNNDNHGCTCLSNVALHLYMSSLNCEICGLVLYLFETKEVCITLFVVFVANAVMPKVL